MFDHSQPSLVTGVLALKELKTKIGSQPVPHRLFNLTKLRSHGDEPPQMLGGREGRLVQHQCFMQTAQSASPSSRAANGAAVTVPPLGVFFPGLFWAL